MSQRQDAIRNIYRNNAPSGAFEKLWEWGERGDSWHERYRRFRALQFWAQGHRDESSGDERHAWNRRRRAYRNRKRRIWEVHHQPAPAPSPSVGCGSCGSPAWGGADSILVAEANPIAGRHGAPVTSAKRSWSAGSDHCYCTPCASARDYGTFSGAPLAAELGRHFGFPFTPVGTYSGHNIVRCGKTFRVQILWAVSGHFNHVHAGIRYVGTFAKIALRVPGVRTIAARVMDRRRVHLEEDCDRATA